MTWSSSCKRLFEMPLFRDRSAQTRCDLLRGPFLLSCTAETAALPHPEACGSRRLQSRSLARCRSNNRLDDTVSGALAVATLANSKSSALLVIFRIAVSHQILVQMLLVTCVAGEWLSSAVNDCLRSRIKSASPHREPKNRSPVGLKLNLLAVDGSSRRFLYDARWWRIVKLVQRGLFSARKTATIRFNSSNRKRFAVLPVS